MFIKVVGTSPRDPINNLPSNESSIAGSFSFIYLFLFFWAEPTSADSSSAATILHGHFSLIE